MHPLSRHRDEWLSDKYHSGQDCDVDLGHGTICGRRELTLTHNYLEHILSPIEPAIPSIPGKKWTRRHIAKASKTIYSCKKNTRTTMVSSFWFPVEVRVMR
jgi:hypothetical protein